VVYGGIVVTTIAFQPSASASPPFQSQVTLDGVSYSMQTMWNIYAQRWYVSLVDQSGNVVINQPLIGSPSSSNIYLFPNMFTTSTVVYVPSTGNFIVGP